VNAVNLYFIEHLLGLFLVFTALGGLAVHVINGGGRDHPYRKPLAALHGIGLLMALMGGFGMQARLQVGWPGWLIVKIVVWLALGGLYAVLLRKPGAGRLVMGLLPILAALALFMVRLKPF
jgi:hypothetical protein